MARSNSRSWLKKFKGSPKSASNVRAAIGDLIVEIGNERVRSPLGGANAPVVSRMELLRQALLTRAFVDGDPEAVGLAHEYLQDNSGEGGSGLGSPDVDADHRAELEQEPSEACISLVSGASSEGSGKLSERGGKSTEDCSSTATRQEAYRGNFE